MRIVIADDSRTARTFLRQCLEIVGYGEATFVDAANGAEALALVKAEPADLLVTDLNMPEMDGQELLRRISASPRAFGATIVVVSSSCNAARAKELQALGAAAVLAKPLTPAKLAEALESVLPQPGECP